MRGLPPIAQWLASSSELVRRIAVVAAILFVVVSGVAAQQGQQQSAPAQQPYVDPNVNMVRGTTFPFGDPYLQRQNEPSIAVSTRNPCHLLAGANDYRSVDIPFDDTIPPNTENNLSLAGDAWLGLFKSFDCGTKWQSSLLPGYPQDNSSLASELKGHAAGADPTVRAGTNGLFYYSGMVFNRGSQGTSKIFMARYIDNNNKERGDPIEFLGVSIVDTGTKGQFLDKPWMAVDVPRASYGPGSQLGGNQTCVVNSQTLPAGNVYMAWAKFTGTSNQHSKLMFAKSSDCGVTWKQHPITNNQSLSQGANIAVAPHDGTIYLTWREFAATNGANKPVNFWIVTSSDGGESFSAPKKIASDVITFDQPRSTSTFRSNALPAIVADHQDRVYVAWSGRGHAWTYNAQQQVTPNDDARIVMVMSSDRGQTFTSAPFPIDPNPARGHQMMPSLSFSAGKIQAIWYDAREDASGVFEKYIDDNQTTTLLHTIDVRGAQAFPASPPVFVADNSVSVEISKYRKWNLEIKDSTGHVTGYESKEIGSNPPNLGMYANGTTPFIGDYIDVSGVPSFPVQTTSGQLWQPNIGPLNMLGVAAANLSTSGFPTLPTFHATWTDNRDVRIEQCLADPNNPTAQTVGQRNANIYTARLTKGLYVGSPGNTKPFGFRLNPKTKQQELIQRAFVVFAQNTTETLKFFRFKIDSEPPGGRASFRQFDHNGSLTEVIVAIPAVSTVARTLYATSTDVNAQLLVNVEQYDHSTEKEPVIGPDGKPVLDEFEHPKLDWRWFAVTDGLRGSVLLNPDRTNPPILDPDILGDVPQIATQEVHDPSMFDAQFFKRKTKSRRLDVLNAETPDPENPDPENPDPENPDPENQDPQNPDPENPDPENPDPENPDPENPDPENQSARNPDPENSLLEVPLTALSDAELQSAAITDIQWRVHNAGNTTSAYKFRPSLNEKFPNRKYQLIVTRRSMALALGPDCKPIYKSTNQVLVNIVNFQPKTPDPENPDPENPDPENPDPENPDPENPDPENANFFLAPEETATVTLREFDLAPPPPDPDPDPNPPPEESRRDEVAAKTAAQAANTGETKVSSAVAGPDLTLFDVAATVAPAISRPGKPATVTFTLSNRGTGPATAPPGKQIETRVYFSGDTTINHDGQNADILLTTIVQPSPFAYCTTEVLDSSCSTNSSANITVPAIPGTSYVIIVTDEDDDIFEADELNNLVVVPIVVANYQLTFSQQPTDTTQDFTMAPVQVAITHPDGVDVTALDVPTVTLAIQNNPSNPAATLLGTTAQNNINGFATFSDLKIGASANGFTLSASALFSNAAVSAAFNIETDLPPVTVNDTYTTNEETALSPSAPGVLANDSDPSTKGTKPAAYVFDAVKETNPSSGSVTVNANGSFTYVPNQDFAGSDSFTYRARDGRPGNTTIGTVNITVVNVNDAPSFTKGADQVVNEDAGAQTVPGWATNISAGPANESSQAFDFVVTNDNNALFSSQPLVAANGALTYTGAANASGSATVTVRLHDSGGTADNGVDTSAPQTFTITIAGVNDAPVAVADSYSINEDGSLGVDAGQPVNNHYSSGLLANDTDSENSLLVVEYLTTTTNGTLLPHANGSFSYTPNASFFGTDSFTYRAFDGSTTGNTVTVTITVTSVNDVPSFTKGANQSVATNSPAQTVANWATGISAGPSNESAQLVDFIVTNDNNAIFNVQPAVSAAGTLTYTPKQNQSGTATVTIRIHDNGGTANGGVDTSAPQTFTIAITSAPQTYVVINTNDSGTGSLRAALINANLNASADTITFNIPGAGVRTITPLTPLPSVVFPVVINATTQPGYSGTPLIELNGASAGPGANGFTVNTTNVTIRGFKITGFGAAGVAITDPGTGTSTGNRVSQNSIVNNGGLGIDLMPTVGGNLVGGITANDSLDGDNGPNGLQNFPVVTAAFVTGSSTLITGSLNSVPNTAYTIELFSNAAADPGGYGEGQTYLTSLSATTDDAGNATFSTTWAAALSGFVTATATDPNGNTSEFSQARVATNDDILTVTDFAMTTNPASNDLDPNVANPSVRTTYKGLAGNNPSLLSPGEVAIIAKPGRAYFTGGNSAQGTDGRVGLLDLATNTVTAVTTMKGNVGSQLTRVNQATEIVYMRAGLNLVAIDGRAGSPTVNKPILNINLGTIQSMALDQAHGRLYLTTTTTGGQLIANGRITEVDIDPNSATFHQVVDEITVPGANATATAIGVNPATGKVYVSVTGTQAGLYVGDPQAQTMNQIFASGPTGNITSIAVNDIDNVIYAVGQSTLHAIDGSNDTRVATIGLAAAASAGSLDTRLAIDRINGRVFVRLGSFPNPSNLVVVDGKKTNATYNTILGTVNLGREGGSATMAVDETGHRVIATSPQDLRAHIIDSANAIVATIMTTQPTPRVTINPISRRAYLSSAFGFIKVVDMATLTTVTDVHVGTEEFGVAVDPLTHSAYISETGLGTAVKRLAETGIIGSVTLPHVDGREEYTVRNNATNTIYALNGAATAAGGSDALPGFVHVISGNPPYTVTASVPVGANPFGLTVDEASNKIYVGNGNSSGFPGGISIINGVNNQVTPADMSAIPSTASPASVSVGRDMVVITSGATAGRLYFRTIAGTSTQMLGMLNGTIASPVSIGSNVSVNIIRYNPVLNRLYVGISSITGGPNQILLIDPTTNQIIETWTVGSPTTFRTNQSYIATNNTTGRVFIADFDENKLEVAEGLGFIASIPMPFGPSAVAVDEVRNRVYVANAIARSLTVVDGSTLRVVRTLALPITPVQIDVDSTISPARLYVSATANEGAISVIDDPNTAAPQITSVTQGAHGAVVLNADGSVTYTPTSGYVGADSYTYTTSNGTSTANVTVYAEMSILPAALPNGMVGQGYSQQLTKTGGSGASVEWTVSGFPPGGLHLSSTGLLSGTLLQSGNFTFTVSARDLGQDLLSESRTYTIIVGPPVIAPTGVPSATVNVPYSTQLFAGGATGAVTWSLNTNGHPLLNWLSISSTGVLSGTPPAYGTTPSFTVTATDSATPNPQVATRSYTIFVGGPLTMADLREGVVLETESSVSFLGGNGARALTADTNNPLQAKVTNGQLPPGITLGTAGVFTGSPTRHGTYNFSLELRDCINNSCGAGVQQQVVPKNVAWRVSAKDQQGSSFGGPTITLGGSPNRKLAQVFTVGAQGSLTAVGFTNITCPTTQTPVTVDIQRLTQSGQPDGTTIATGTAVGGNFNAIALTPATPVAIGERLAFVVSAGGTLTCTLPSPAQFDNYQGGDAYLSTGGGNWSKLSNADVDNNGTIDGVYDLPNWRTLVQPALDVTYLATAQGGNTATVLNDGRVLIVGASGVTTTVHIYDPATNLTTATGSLNRPRQNATATLLGNGTVLIVGGRDGNNNKHATAEIYDPSTGQFTMLADQLPTRLQNARDNHRAVRYSVNGAEKVLITGGVNSAGTTLAAVEIYDTATQTFSMIQNNLNGRQSHAAVLLNSGKILIAGGYTNGGSQSAEVFNPATNTFSTTSTSMLVTNRGLTTGTLLSDGRVLVTGGQSGDIRNEAEIYDPTIGANGSWSATGNMSTPRYQHTATLLPNGNVLIAGGFANQTISSWTLPLETMETFDPASGTFSNAGSMETRRGSFASARLANGKVFHVGGFSQGWLTGNTGETFDSATAPTFSPSTLAPGSPGVAYSAVTFTGFDVNQNSYAIKHVGGQLPPGMTYTQSTRTLSGTPTTAGIYKFALEVSDSPTHLNVQTLTLVVGSVNTITSPYRLPDAAQNQPYSQQLTATGTGNTWSILPPTQSSPNNLPPAGITLTSGGVLQGAPTFQGYFNFGVRAVDSQGVEAIKVLSINVVGALQITTTTLNNPELFNSMGCISTSGGSGTRTYSIVSGALPTGVTLSGTNSCFQGQVKATGAHTFRVRVTDQTFNNPQTAEQTYTINVYAADQSASSNFSAPAITFGAGTGRKLAEKVITGITGPLRGIRMNGLTCTTNGTNVSVEIHGLDPSGAPNSTVMAAGNGVSPLGTIYLNTELIMAADEPFTVVFDAGASCTLQPSTFDSYPGDGFVQNGGGAWQRLQDFDGRFDIPFISVVEPVPGLTVMNAYRGSATETLLGNGKVLIAGGECCGATGTAELFDPATNTTTPTANNISSRQGHTATLLTDGTVLLTGGTRCVTTPPNNFCTTEYQASAEIYNPATNTFSATGSMGIGRWAHRATLLQNGKVLITGGYGGPGNGSTLNTAEIYDPATSVFSAVNGTMTAARQSHTATLLSDGRVLIAAGYGGGSSTELYSPGAQPFTAGPNLSTSRGRHTATLLSDGNVLITGGTGGNAGEALASSDLYVPNAANGTIASAPAMTMPRIDHQMLLLDDDSVLISGGYSDSTCCYPHAPTAQLERYVPGPAPPAFVPAGAMIAARYVHTATLLANGKVLMSGTFGWSSTAGRTAEVFDAVNLPARLITSDVAVPRNAPFTETFPATGGSGGPYTIVVMSGTAPAGMLVQNQNTLTGSPTQSGVFQFGVKITDGGGRISYQLYTLRVDPLRITTQSLPVAYNGVQYTGAAVASAGGTGTVTFMIVPNSGSLPPGLSLNQNTGAITGTPTVSCCFYSFVVRATDGTGQTTQKPLSISVQNPLSISTMTLGDGLAGSTYFGSLFSQSGTNPFTWSISGQPQGLQINASTGQFLTSYPGDVLRETGQFFVAAQVTDSSNPMQTANRTLSLNVYAFEQSTGSMIGPPNVTIPSSTKFAQVYKAATPYGIAAVQPFQLFCDAGVTLTAKVFPVTLTDAPDDSGAPLTTGSLTSNQSGFFNAQYLVFAPHVAMATDTKFAVVYSADGPCTQKDWPDGDFYNRGDSWLDDGTGWALASTEIGRYDLPHSTLVMPPSNAFRFLAGWRGGHSAVTLTDGRVFMAGSDQYTEIYDPSTNTFTLTANMSHGRQDATATRLQNGKVLVAGGNYWNGSATVTAATTQIFIPSTGQFQASQNMTSGRSKHTATLLNNGRVLITGGQFFDGVLWNNLDSADLFDANGNFITSFTMSTPRAEHTATLLGDGRVVIIGGWTNGGSVPIAEIYDPSAGANGSFTTSINSAISWPSQHTATLLTTGPRSGQVLIAGGWGSPQLNPSYFFDPSDNTFSNAPSLLTRRLEHTATMMADGRILFAGGITDTSVWGSTASVEVYDPATGNQSYVGDLLTKRNSHTAHLVSTPGGLRLAIVAGYGESSLTGNTLELFTPPQ